MSSYRVPDLQIVLIAEYRNRVEFLGYQTMPRSFDSVLDQIVQMIELNEQAVYARYEGRHNSDQFTFPRELTSEEKRKQAEVIYTKFFAAGKLIKPSAAQMVKYVDNYLYQCAEGDQFTQSALFQDLQRFANTCARVAIGQAYERAEWGMK